jgi:hypothetical protein
MFSSVCFWFDMGQRYKKERESARLPGKSGLGITDTLPRAFSFFRRRTILRILLLVLAAASIACSAEVYSLMNFAPAYPGQAELFGRLGFDVVQRYQDGSVDFVAGSHERLLLMENGLAATTRIADMEGYYRALNGTSRSMGGFYTWNEIDTWIDSLAAANPSITSVESIGDTYQGRPQRVVKLSVNNTFGADDPSMANAWYDGLIHAREGSSMRNVRYWMMWLCSNYQRNGYCGY